MFRRRIGFVVAAVVATTWVGMAASPTSATTPKPPKFAGAAPAAVTCAVKAKLKFSSPLTLSGGVSSVTVKATLKDCVSGDSALVIKKGTLTGSFAGSPINCAGPSSGVAKGTFSIAWKGLVNGVVRTTTYKGHATFANSPVTTAGEQLVSNAFGQEGLQILGADSGSFPGAMSLSAFSTDTAATVTQMCETRTTTPAGHGKGIKTLTLTGSATVGSVGQMASDGAGFCAALASGLVNCWGSGTDGALGNNSVADSRVPVIIAVTTATGLASDATHSYCASLRSGAVDCWGLDTDGELGNGTSGGDSLVPVAVSGVTSAVAVVSDGDHSYCALLASGGADCWGLGTSGELGNGASTTSDVAVAVSGLSGATSLAGEGNGSYCAVVSGGAVECWGDNGSGDLGDNSTTDAPVPVMVTGLSGASSVVSDGTHSYCAVLTSGPVECWGAGTDGELGNGATATSHVPVTVTGISARSLASNGNHSYCAVAAGAVDCWGLGGIGQLGDGATANSDVPVAASGIGDAASVGGDGSNAYCAVLATEAVACWGAGGSGQLGNGGGANSDVPVTAGPMGPAVSIVQEGSATFCAPLASNAVDCWGSNGGGALGDGSGGAQSLVPETVSDLTL